MDPLKAFIVKPTPDSVESRFTANRINSQSDLSGKENYSQSWKKRTPTRIQKKPVIHAEVLTTSEHFSSINKLSQMEIEHNQGKAKMILKLQRVLKGLAHTNLKMREDTPLDECTDVQVSQSKDAVQKFKSGYPVETEDDILLSQKIAKYEKNLTKANELLDQCTLFDEKSKHSFVLGVQGLVDNSTIEVLNDLDDAKHQFSNIIPEDAMDSRAQELHDEI